MISEHQRTTDNLKKKKKKKPFRDKLQECIKALNKNFSIIGLSETHLKDKPSDFYSFSGYNVEYMNRMGGRKVAYVCTYLPKSNTHYG